MPKFIVETYGFQQTFQAKDLRDLRRVVRKPRKSKEDPLPVDPKDIGPNDVVYAPDGYIYRLEDVLFPRGPIRPYSITVARIHLPTRTLDDEGMPPRWEFLLAPPERN